MGLLSLGYFKLKSNVIQALSDISGKVKHIPYRDSKLTRIL